MAQHQPWSLKRFLIGRALKNRELRGERLRTLAGLSILAPDALSSVAYGTEEILVVLASIGAVALWFSLPIALTIVLLLVVLVISYRQVIEAYPGGGGAYVVGRDSVGRLPSLVAGASLLVDYTLTIAVSVTAGGDAMISAFPQLAHFRVLFDVLLIAIICLVNLRGVRESATLFAAPTYTFVVMVLIMVGVGLWRGGLHGLAAHHALVPRDIGGVSLFLLLRAFSSGSSALTGVEAISNGVPLFREPAVRSAKAAMAMLGILLGTMFMGTTVLAFAFRIVPLPDNTVLSQVAQHAFGRSIFYYILAFATTAILVLAANTSFAGFPQLAYTMAKDKFMPHLFQTRGDRLVFTNGIMFEAVAAAFLIIVFGGSTARLIPLYAIGVYAGFTISQFGLVMQRARRARASGGMQPGDLPKSLVNGFGAVLTAVVVVVFAVTKFAEGAWVVLIVIPLLVLCFLKIHRHYEATAAELRLPSFDFHPEIRPSMVIVPVSTVTRVVANALSYARSIADTVVALHVSSDPEETQKFHERWEQWNPPGVRLVTIESQYRSVVQPILRYIDLLRMQSPDATITVVIPEFVVGRWWQSILHNQMGILLQARLRLRRDVVIVAVPYRLSGR
jgi:amino acid transporter